MLGIGLQIQNIRSFLSGLSPLQKYFKERVLADGGIVESLNCIGDYNMTKIQSSFYVRVLKDGGIVESLECINNF